MGHPVNSCSRPHCHIYHAYNLHTSTHPQLARQRRAVVHSTSGTGYPTTSPMLTQPSPRPSPSPPKISELPSVPLPSPAGTPSLPSTHPAEAAAPPPPGAPQPADAQPPGFTLRRLVVFSGLVLGYSAYYLTRNSLTYTAPVMVADPALGFSLSQIGAMTSIFPIAYGTQGPSHLPLGPALLLHTAHSMTFHSHRS